VGETNESSSIIEKLVTKTSDIVAKRAPDKYTNMTIKEILQLAIDQKVSEDRLVCPKCGNEYKNKHRLLQHLQNQLKDCRDKIPRYEQNNICPTCKKSYANVYIMRTHYNKKLCKNPSE